MSSRYNIQQPEITVINYLVRENILDEHSNQVNNHAFGYACYEYYRQGKRTDEFDAILLEEAAGRKRMLDVCCGAGATVHALLQNNPDRIYAIDQQPFYLSLLQGTLASSRDEYCGKVIVNTGDAHKLQLADNALDFVVCRAALQYLHAPTALREMYRVLDEQGKVFLLVHGPGYIIDYLLLRKKGWDTKTVSSMAAALRGFRSLPAMKLLTMRGLRRQLKKAGFHNIRLLRSHEWEVWGGLPIYYAVIAEK